MGGMTGIKAKGELIICGSLVGGLLQAISDAATRRLGVENEWLTPCHCHDMVGVEGMGGRLETELNRVRLRSSGSVTGD
jgi:hypothetical protein